MSQQINLYNVSLLKRKSILSATNLLIVFGLSIAILATASVVLRMRTAEMQKSAAQSSLQLKELSDQAAISRKAHSTKLKSPVLEQELRTIEALMLRRYQIVQILQNSEFGNTDGYSAYLIAFARRIPENLWLTGFSVEGAGYDLVLSGRTLRGELVPQYVSQLKQEKIMQGKSFSTLQLERPLLPIATSADQPPKKPEPAPYLAFQLHSSELESKAQANGVKQP
nr:PilN domain-containing protein [uncultured Undibacterium sp.]